MKCVFLAAILAAGASGCITTPQAEALKYPRRPLSATERSIVSDAVKSGLKDPDSAHFQWFTAIIRNGSSFPYCGLVNSKNSYGGYPGFAPFVSNINLDEDGNVLKASLAGIANVNIADADPVAGECRHYGYPVE